MSLPRIEREAGFRISAHMEPKGDQPEAIAALVDGIRSGHRFQTLLGATGTGKTFTIASLIQQLQRPTLVIAHNKTLTAQLCNEFRELFPDNAVHYFVSYYDYYQPEAYLPQTDTYIEKDSSINDEIDRLRHAATSALFERRDVIIVASVSCIYGLGAPENYSEMSVVISKSEPQDRDDLMRQLIGLQYERNEIGFERGTFRARGDTLEIIPVYEEHVLRIEFFGNDIERIAVLDPVTGHPIREQDEVRIYPASHFITPEQQTRRAMETIEKELDKRLEQLRSRGQLLEAQRLEQRTRYDLEMIQEMGYCSGIENYSRHLDGRRAGQPRPYFSTTSPTTSCWLSMSRIRQSPRSGACITGIGRGRKRWWSSASDSRRPSTTARSPSRNSRSVPDRWCSPRRPPGRTSGSTPRR